jgi:NAD(P)-dependent dehydrogenase (short-subunit alcohol dehydrogenase family)
LLNNKNFSIVFFSSVAVQTGMAFHSSTATAKEGVEGLVCSLAAELAPTIRVNAVAPSLTDTPLAENLLSNEDKRNRSADRHPLKSVGSPTDQAEAALYLLSERSGWMTGQIFMLTEVCQHSGKFG